MSEFVKGDTVHVYGIMNHFGDTKQFIGRVEIERDGKKHILESYNPPFIEKKRGKWYVEGNEYNF